MMKRDSKNSSKIKVREIRLDSETQEVSTEPKRNTELVIVTYVFAFMFLLMAGYLIYFNVVKRDEINANANNTKQDSQSDKIIRGSIVTDDGTVLASTSVNSDGTETRTYPYENVFAHVVGYASNGKAGLEAAANYDLMTSHSSLLNQIKNGENNEKIKGDNVVVTLNPVIQQAAYYALGSYKGAVVVMEPDSGKILAMVSKPDFNPNTISEEWETMVSDDTNSSLLNRAAQGLYPPGSTFKILTTLAYLQQNNDIYSGFSFDCTGSLTQNDVTITCYNGNVHGAEDLKTAFAHSCNTAFANIGLNLDNGAFRKLAEKFLFNNSLPTSLTHSDSVFKLDKDTSYGEVMTTAIGQGDTLVTPLHMALITSTVANGGIMMTPYYVERIETYDGDVVSETRPSAYKELMSTQEAGILTDFMKETVNSGTGTALSYSGYSVAGKTGSAEYETNGVTGTHSWFVGFSNVDDPDIVVAVIAEDGGTGSQTAVPIAKAIFDAYYNAGY
ncbi:MAG: penicillin-binding transpeptidase domain-containing protein [Lachnospiraceae bacterium]|nr:penicillin-binding transpeptidase domain-containing protein [Lachnospiraceae bacterium]